MFPLNGTFIRLLYRRISREKSWEKRPARSLFALIFGPSFFPPLLSDSFQSPAACNAYISIRELMSNLDENEELAQKRKTSEKEKRKERNSQK